MTAQTPDQLIAEHNQLDSHVKGESKRFAEYLKPHEDRIAEIKNLLLAFLNTQKLDNVKTQEGTAYISEIMTPKIVDRDAFLDFVEQNWDSFGNELMQLSAPQKEAMRTYMEANAGKTPPGTEVSFFRRVNIRRT